MKIIKTIKTPSYSFTPIYDGGYSSDSEIEIDVIGEKISFLAIEIIEGMFPPINNFTQDEKKILNTNFGIGYVNRSHDGGGVVYIRKHLTNKKYIFYFGIDEVSNSHYLIYNHGIVEVEV